MLGRISSGGKLKNTKKVFDEIYKSLKPDGYLVFSENLYSTFVHDYLRKKYKNDGWYYFKKPELVKLINDSNFKIVKNETFGLIGCLGRNEFQRTILSYFDKYFFNHFIPSSNHYIFLFCIKKTLICLYLDYSL